MKSSRSIGSVILALFAATGMAGAQIVSIKGSDTLGAQLVPQLAEAFNAKHKDKPVKFEIAAEGSAVAFTALTNGTAHVGMSSRQATPAELAAANAKGIKLNEVVACHDMIVVIVNKSNPLKKLTQKQVEKIFTGQVKDWSEVGGMPGATSIYTRNTASGTYKDWQKMAMAGRDYAKGAQKMAGGEQVVEEVTSNKNGIGYVGLAFSDKPGIKPLTIDDTAPVAANAEKYPYSRKCYYYYLPENADANAKEFVAFATSEEGNAIGKSLGFVPVK